MYYMSDIHKGRLVRAPSMFFNASPAERELVCNGMGPKGYGWLVPDTMYGLDMGAAGDVHDWMYAHPNGLTQKHCDDLFYANMLSIIHQHGGWDWVQWLRRRRALKYYKAVQVGGSKHFRGNGDVG